MWRALIVSDEITQFDEDLLMKKLALDLRPPQRGATVTEGLRRRPLHKWSRPSGGRLKSRELCLTSTSNHSDPQVNPLCPHPPQTTSYQAHTNPNSTPSLLQKTFETHNIRLANEKSVTNQPVHIIALHDIQIDIFYKKTQRQAFPAGWPSNDVFPSMAVIYKSATNQ